MLSRAAENLYWMARYLERAENTARLINATQQLLLDLPEGASVGWEALTRIVGLGTLFQQTYAKADEASVVDFLMASPRNPGSIQSCVRHARENCRTMRDLLPRDLWLRVNSLYLSSRRYSQPGTTRQDRRRMLEELGRCLRRLHDEVKILHAHLARPGPAGAGGLGGAPGEGEDLDLVLVLVVGGLSVDAVELQEHVDRRFRGAEVAQQRPLLRREAFDFNGGGRHESLVLEHRPHGRAHDLLRLGKVKRDLVAEPPAGRRHLV
jgi:hypothetical protein